MALTLGDNFSYQGTKPLDARLTYSTVAAMKAVADATMYNGCMAYCTATSKTYQWKSTNTVDETLGRWREFTSGGGGASSLSDLSDTDISLPSNGQVLKYDSESGKWENANESGGDISGKADKVSGATNGNFAGLDANGNLTDSGSKPSDFLTSHQDISGKADKVSSATNGNFAGLDANGNLTDSGKKASDFASFPNGGTTGQALVKHSNTDGDVEWATVSADTSKLYSTDDTAFTGIADGDYIPVYDTSVATKKKSLWSNIKSLLKTYFDTLYQGVLTAGTNIGISGNVISATNTISLNFSTTEQAVGKWIDGNTLYQKTLNFGALPNNTDKQLTTGMAYSNCKIKYMFGYAVKSSEGRLITLPRVSYNAIGSCIDLGIKVTNGTCFISVQTGGSFSDYNESYITILYTKS